MDPRAHHSLQPIWHLQGVLKINDKQRKLKGKYLVLKKTLLNSHGISSAIFAGLNGTQIMLIIYSNRLYLASAVMRPNTNIQPNSSISLHHITISTSILTLPLIKVAVWLEYIYMGAAGQLCINVHFYNM